MNVVFEPKLDMPVGAVAPEAYDISLGKVPSGNFVVSRHRDGSVASTYGQLIWDLSAYHPEVQTCTFSFCYWAKGEITPARLLLSHEARYLLFLLIWVREGNPLSLGTLRNYLAVIKALALHAEDISCRIRDLLSNEKLLWPFINTQCSGWTTQTIGSLLPFLAKLGRDNLGFDVVENKEIQKIYALGKQYRATIKQHAPIPSRIYSHILGKLILELNEWESVADDMLSVLRACGNDQCTGRSARKQNEIAKKYRTPKTLLPNFSQIASKDCLDYFAKKSCHPNVRSLSALICEIQASAKLTVQAFSGMREDEAISLPYHCLETMVANGKTHYVILGRTTKLNNGRVKRTRWVTNQDGYRAIKLAQKIADAIYAAFGVSAQKATTRTNSHPLFVSVSYLALAGYSLKPIDNHFRAGNISLERMQSLRARLEPMIEDTDICELEHIDPHRSWRTEERFKVGKPWLFTSHQLRRSLALYAQRSGFVSLPSLRRQLQHITNEMSCYYAKGSAFAKNFIGEDREHFGLEWQKTEPESAALSYVSNVLLSNDILFGGHANWVEHRLKDSSGVLMANREVTVRRFRKGEIGYRETPIGGCTNIGECEQPAINWLDVDCLRENCRNLVGNMTKLERVIVAQEKLVSALEQNTIEYRTEKTDLEVLVATREAVLQQRKVNCA
jgi:DNA-binding PadR family transcriptional regulator